MNRVLLAVAAAAGLSLATGGAAIAQTVQQTPGPYVAVNLGSGLAGRTKLDVTDVGNGKEDLKAGLFASGAAGYSLGNGFAVEGELLYLSNEIKTHDLNAFFGVDLNAKVKTTGVMANVHYAVAPIGPLVGHVGAGVGYGEAKYTVLGDSISKDGLMWQLMAGLSWPLTDKASLDASYRYVRSHQVKDSVDVGTGPQEFKLTTGTHVLSVGVRSRF